MRRPRVHDTFAPEALAVEVSTHTGSTGPARARTDVGVRADLFIAAPLPASWIAGAARLPGRALHVAVVLRFFAGLRRSRTVRVPLGRLLRWGLSRDAARRGLSELERAGLVTVERKPGRQPLVTLVDVPADPSVDPRANAT